MDLFKSKDTQALQTSLNRAKMYNTNRPSEVNTDGVVNGDLIKSKGEGSKGGKVIGHTKSGKAIYETHDHEGHKDFTKEDHHDAATHHIDEWNKKKQPLPFEDDHSHINNATGHANKYKEQSGKKYSYKEVEEARKELHPKAQEYYNQHKENYDKMDDSQKKKYLAQVKTTHEVGSSMKGEKTEDAKHRFAAHAKFLKDHK